MEGVHEDLKWWFGVVHDGTLVSKLESEGEMVLRVEVLWLTELLEGDPEYLEFVLEGVESLEGSQVPPPGADFKYTDLREDHVAAYFDCIDVPGVEEAWWWHLRASTIRCALPGGETLSREQVQDRLSGSF